MENKSKIGSLVTCSLFLTLGVILLLLYAFMKEIPYKYFVITLGVCLIVISIIGFVVVSRYGKNDQKLQNEHINSFLTSVVCPDYYTRDNNNVCVNSYSNSQFTYTIVDAGSNVDLNMYLNKPMHSACLQLDLENRSNLYPWTDLQSKCSFQVSMSKA